MEQTKKSEKDTQTKRTFSDQQEVLLTQELKSVPKAYSKAAISQCLRHEFNIDVGTISRVLEISVHNLYANLRGRNVIPWDNRPEKRRLTNYIKNKIGKTGTPIRLFKVNDDNHPVVYAVTVDESLDPDNLSILSVGHMGRHRRDEIRYRVRRGDYEEVNIITTPYQYEKISDIKKKIKKL